MTYFPDYRKDADKLTDIDKSYWDGYKYAMEMARAIFEGVFDNADEELNSEIMEEFEMLAECSEIELMCSLVEGNDAYENVDFSDANHPIKIRKEVNNE